MSFVLPSVGGGSQRSSKPLLRCVYMCRYVHSVSCTPTYVQPRGDPGACAGSYTELEHFLLHLSPFQYFPRTLRPVGLLFPGSTGQRNGVSESQLQALPLGHSSTCGAASRRRCGRGGEESPRHSPWPGPPLQESTSRTVR